ncbi:MULTISPECIES: DUF924 family protein [Pseudomonas]|jgi:uncharacterized protein (DUF924 family)|uniref:Uncharacterized conserved protein, DUF924 family n=2 Tax=Pseudomonas fluorescens group TaxID=136843 RepID=A0ABY0VGU6_9PSED|nr:MULTISPECIES: DUF924 family protein [Pseudomonas]MBU0525693.1 DUF924 domain-containing protein [Gammaproteobacteria bacterium]MDF9883594.1 uncharacterized protein (DUF924 family) [Pseudomonas silensiensis]MBU0818289.1 DUF924 domain-containing protein [Gammaproteobacteria bacterium]MBU0840099.1 DUF924 domain-containing protein [Gammaproteobacteria bacterium]MBU1840737.1 DUF924 domain-containing protein [Gammaproteobacteria bacterium]
MTAPWQPLLEWWFGTFESPQDIAADKGKLWFGKRDSQDLEAQTRFGDWVEQALAGGLTEWAQRPEGWLALVLLLDQLPRMIFRDTPKSFSGDLRAQALVAQGIAADFDRQLRPIQRVFIYLVFEHCENLAVQNEAVSRYIDLVKQQPEGDQALFTDYLNYAEKHQKVIARFGRFPHRNAVLGRESTAEELAFLSGPGSRF